MAKIGITETVLRDAHQSLIATRMRTDEFEDILEKMDKIGYHSLECWGGATFDSCLRFLDEDPWDSFVLFVKNVLTQSFKCFSEVRICSATAIILMNSLIIL